MKKSISIILMILMLISCAYAEADSQNPNTLSGYWLDSWSGRANLTITFDGQRHCAVVRWANSAFETVQWEMSGLFENGVLRAQDCVKTSRFYAEDGSEEIVVHYENEVSALTLTDDVISWTDPEGMGSECRFERYAELDMRDVYNPERHAHMYITDIYSVEDGALYCQGTLGTIHENGELSGFDLSKTLTFSLPPDSDVRLPSEIAGKEPSEPLNDPAAWFDALDREADFGFYAILSLNEAGEIVKLVYSEDQPDAPEAPSAKEESVMIAPAPPLGR